MRTITTAGVLLVLTAMAAAEPRIAIHPSNELLDVTIDGGYALQGSALTLSIDGGAPVTASQFAREALPIDLAFVWCRAEKWHRVPMFMTPDSSILDVFTAAVDNSRLADAGPPGSTYSVIGYTDNVTPMHSGQLAELPKSLFAHLTSESYQCGELFDAISVGLSRLAAGRAPRKALIVLSDGVDSSRSNPSEIRRYAADRNIDVFAVVIPRDGFLFPVLHEAIPNTRYFRPNDPGAWFEVQRTLTSIADQLRGRYHARFEPGLLPMDGGLHRFDVAHNGQHVASTTLTLPKSNEPNTSVDAPITPLIAPPREAPLIGSWLAIVAGVLTGIVGMAVVGWVMRRRRRALIDPCPPP